MFQNKNTKWTVHRRYNEFKELHKEISEIGNAPIFPSKNYVTKFNPEFLEKRRKELELYLNTTLSSHPTITLVFLDIEGSSVSYLFPREFSTDSLETLNNRETKRILKEKIQSKRKELDSLDEKYFLFLI